VASLAFLPEIRVKKREETSRWLTMKISMSSLAISFAILSIILAMLGRNPAAIYGMAFSRTFGSLYGVSFLGLKFIPLLLCSVGLVIAFKAGVWNIGAEGQLLMGAVASTWVALYAMPNAPGPVLVACMFTLGFLAGAAWAIIPALLKSTLDVNEVITTLMMNYVAMQLVNYLIQGPWRGPYMFPKTREIPIQAQLGLIPGTSIHYPTLIIGLTSTVLAYVMMERTKFGFELRVVGSNPRAARYAGISIPRVILLVMALSGGLAGLAGVGEVAGNPAHHGLYYPESVSAGYGYTAIIVAWLSRLNPLGLPLATLFVAAVLVSGYFMKIALKIEVAHELVNIFNGVVLICLVAGELLTRYRVQVRWGRHGGV